MTMPNIPITLLAAAAKPVVQQPIEDEQLKAKLSLETVRLENQTTPSKSTEQTLSIFEGENKFDTDGDAFLTSDELKAKGISDEAIANAKEKYDVDKNGKFDALEVKKYFDDQNGTENQPTVEAANKVAANDAAKKGFKTAV